MKINHAIIAAAVAIAFSAKADAQMENKPLDAARDPKPTVLTPKLDKSGIKPGAKTESAASGTAALELIQTHNCFTCHAIDKKAIGPTWKEVAAKYRGDANAEDQLVKKVSQGGKGVWGKDLVMPPFAPYVKEADIRALVKYILSLK